MEIRKNARQNVLVIADGRVRYATISGVRIYLFVTKNDNKLICMMKYVGFKITDHKTVCNNVFVGQFYTFRKSGCSTIRFKIKFNQVK